MAKAPNPDFPFVHGGGEYATVNNLIKEFGYEIGLSKEFWIKTELDTD